MAAQSATCYVENTVSLDGLWLGMQIEDAAMLQSMAIFRAIGSKEMLFVICSSTHVRN